MLKKVPTPGAKRQAVAHLQEVFEVSQRLAKPAMVVSDNGTELTSMAILRWSRDRGVEWHCIAPGKQQQNAQTNRKIHVRYSC